MKITITGSLGHISKPLTEKLTGQGHEVTLISSNPERADDIKALGAKPAIGSLEDLNFLKDAFNGADAVYTMVPPNNYFDHNLDLPAYYRRLGGNYARAIAQSNVKRVVNLSTIGAHLEEGSGILIGAHDVEQIFNELPPEISLTHMRPTSFYYNLYGYLDMIKTGHIIAVNYGADVLVPWVAPADIAVAVADEITNSLAGRKVRYVASEELTGNEVAGILGKAIGIPDLKWVMVPDQQIQQGLEAAGMHPDIAAGLVEMYSGLHTGRLSEDYKRNRPAVMGEIKMSDFAIEFAAAFQEK